MMISLSFHIAAAWYPEVVSDLLGWIRRLDVAFPYHVRCWTDLDNERCVAKNHGLGENMEMRPPPGGRTEASDPRNGKKRKGKAVVDLCTIKKSRLLEHQTTTRTSTSTSETNPGAEGEDDSDDECQLAQRMRSNAGASQVPRSETVESKMADAGRSRRLETLEGVLMWLRSHGWVWCSFRWGDRYYRS
uniref:Uncharacterized protein LOC104228148 n=1 Tax=Nicotiana sylvestris TaxID=4096 RepID=A0A1U7WW00_NICSY|nr:PREDICTED: uncharacterized protein LOC104228148 [Nicotiana sylvestris]